MTDTATDTQSGARRLDGIDLPVQGRWDIDPDHSNVEFVVRHGLTRMRGRFNSFSGHVTVAADPIESSIEVSIDASSVDTGNEKRDGHLRSGDFFDVQNHPTWSFRSTGLREVGDDGFVVDGELTIRGKTRPVNLIVDSLGVLPADPWGMSRASFSAHARINRDEFGVSWNDLIDGQFPFIGRSIRLELEIELIHRRDEIDQQQT